MNDIFYRVSLKYGIGYGELVREIKKAQVLCGEGDIPADEFIKKLTLVALERYVEDRL